MPTNTAIPTLSTGNVLSATDWDYLVPLNTSIGLFGVGSSYTASPPACTAPNFCMQVGGNAYLTLGASSVGTVTFPTAFPNGLVTVQITPHQNGTQYFTQAPLDTMSTTGFTFTAWNSSGSGVGSGQVVYFEWMAIGW